MRESDLLRHIADRSGDLFGLSGAFGQVVVGPGDDCAVVRTASGNVLLLTVDQLVEGRHFEPGTSIDLIARKAVARSVSDIAAMGGRPSWGLATGLLPDGFAHADELFDAMAKWARHWGCPLIGGDIAFGTKEPAPEGRATRMPLSLTVTVCGWMEHGAAPLLRSGAQVGDELWLTGQVGGSFESGWHLRFEPRIEAGVAAAASGKVHAAIDLSDGLGRDAARVGDASGVRLEIFASTLPISHRCADWVHAVREGEDYELLLATGPTSLAHSEGHTGRTPGALAPVPPPFAAEPGLLGPIGRVRACRAGETPGATIIDAHGREHEAGEMGWDHGA